MRGVRHARSARLPGQAVGDEDAVADQRLERMAQLRALALEGVVHRDEGGLRGLRAVADEDAAREQARGEEGFLEMPLVPDREHVAAEAAQQRQRRQARGEALREGRNEARGRGGAHAWRGRR